MGGRAASRHRTWLRMERRATSQRRYHLCAMIHLIISILYGSERSSDGGKGSRGIGLSASVLLVLGAFRSAFLAASSVGVTAASQGTLSLRRRFGRGDFIALVDAEGVSTRLFLVGETRQATGATVPSGLQFRRAVGIVTDQNIHCVWR
jgi:hypothetical protein